MEHWPLPLRPTNLRSLNLATWFFMTAVQFLNSPQQFSSLPALIVTRVPSLTSSRATTLKATGSDLFDLQCDGNALQRMAGLPVLTRSPWQACSVSWIALKLSIPNGPSGKCIFYWSCRRWWRQNTPEKKEVINVKILDNTKYLLNTLCSNHCCVSHSSTIIVHKQEGFNKEENVSVVVTRYSTDIFKESLVERHTLWIAIEEKWYDGPKKKFDTKPTRTRCRLSGF